ncbi:hypothetical protein L1987_61183 [Smallanthus sonchifolius]|uniref:Uncharacterized protein n=1 Tax=Smallanthus sonchifolius TaxID=185202 RepID=A0ACB9DAI2_9ASTR|nr:hypothetical protein L1987_61183 [Smallanthus sonchifolius]
MLKDLQVFTVVRVIFQLCEEIPCIYAVVVALLSEDTVKTIVTGMLQWPHRIVVPIGGVNVDTRCSDPDYLLHISVHVCSTTLWHASSWFLFCSSRVIIDDMHKSLGLYNTMACTNLIFKL